MFSHSFSFDPTYGYTESALRAIKPPPIPGNFEPFWRETRVLAEATTPSPTLRKIQSQREGVELFEVEYTGIGGFRVGGWLSRPAHGKPTRGVVLGHGYGGREAPDLLIPGPPAVCIQPCARGFHRSARPDLPNDSKDHVIHGIDSPETYIHRYCVADLWLAVSALIEIAPEVSGMIDYIGTSFGGGIGAMALPWEPRFRRGFLGVPSFGHHDIRLTLPSVGAGESVRLLCQQMPEICKTLCFFDSAVASQFCHIPVMVACALFDPAVPPPGQFAVYNALAGEKWLLVRLCDHFEYSGSALDGARIWREQARWFS